MAHASFILVPERPFLGVDDQVVLGQHRDALVLVDGFPALVELGWFAVYAIDADESGLVEFEVWTQDLDGSDYEQRGEAAYEFPTTDRQVLPRQQELWGAVDFAVEAPTEFLLAFKADGETLARVLVVIWQRPG